MKKNNNSSKKMTAKRVGALLGVVLLVSIYVIALLAAVFDFPGADKIFRGCLILTFTVPILLWVYIGLYGKLTNKKTIADLHFMGEAEKTEDSEKK